jgi:hypothetical protein
VPAVEGVAVGVPALAAPAGDRLGGEAGGDPLGLLVGVGLDGAAVGGDGDEARLAAVVVVEELDELPFDPALSSGSPGLGPVESILPSNSVSGPRRRRPAGPMRTMLSGLSGRTSLTV